MLYRRSTVPDAPSARHQSARPALRPSRAYARVHGRVSVSARPWHTAYALGADIATAESSCQPASQRAELASLRSTLAEQVEGFDAPRVETSQPEVVLAAAVVLSLVTRIPDWQQDLSNMDANNAVVTFLEQKERQVQPLSLLPFLTLLTAKAVLNSSRPKERKLRIALRLRYRLISWAYLHHASTYAAGEIKVNLVPALWAAAGELDPWFKTPKAVSMIRSPELRSQLWPADSAAQTLHAYVPIMISLLNAQAVCKFRDRVQVIPAPQAAPKRVHKRNTAMFRVVPRDPAVRKLAGRRAAHRSTITRMRFVLPRFCSLSKVVWRRRQEAAPQSRTSNRMVSIVQLVDALNTAIESSVGEAEGADVAEEAADGIIVGPMTVGATSGGGDTAASIRVVAATVSTVEASAGAVVTLEEDAAMGSTLEGGTGASAAAVEEVAAMGSTLEVGTGASAAAVEEVAAMGFTLEVGTGASAAAVEEVAAMGSTLEGGTGASAAAVEEVAAMGFTLEVGTGASAAAVEEVTAMGSTLEVGTGANAAALEDVLGYNSALEVNVASSRRKKKTMKPGLPIADSDPDKDEVPAHSLQQYDIPIPTLPEMGGTKMQDLLPLLEQVASLITAVSGNIQPSENFKEVIQSAPLDIKANGWEFQAREAFEVCLDDSSALLQALKLPVGQRFITYLDVNTRYYMSQVIIQSVKPPLIALRDVALLLDPTDDALTYFLNIEDFNSRFGSDVVADGIPAIKSTGFWTFYSKLIAGIYSLQSASNLLAAFFSGKSGIPVTAGGLREFVKAVQACSSLTTIVRLFSDANPSEAASAIARYDGDNAEDLNASGTYRTAALSARTAICLLLMSNAPLLYRDGWEALANCLSSDVRYVLSQLILQSTEPQLIALRPVALRLYPKLNIISLLSGNNPSPDTVLHCWQMAALADLDDPVATFTKMSKRTQQAIFKDKRAILLLRLLLRDPVPKAFHSAFAYLLYFCPGAAKSYSLPSGSPKVKLPQFSVSGNYIRLEDWPYVVTKFLQSIVRLQDEKQPLDQRRKMDQSGFGSSQNASPFKLQAQLEIVLCLAMDYTCPEGANTQEAGASTFVSQVLEFVERGPLSNVASQLLAKTISTSSRPQIAALLPMAWELDPSKDLAKHVLLSLPSSSSPALLTVRSILDKAAAEHWSDVMGVVMSALQSLDREKQQLVLSEGGASSLVVLLVDNALTAKSTEEAPPSMRSLLAHLLHLCQGAIAHSTTSDLLPPVRLAVVSQLSISLDAWRYVVPGCLRLCARYSDASEDLEPLMEQVLVLAMRSSSPSSASSPEATAAAFKGLFPSNTRRDPFSCLASDDRRILANIIARSVEAPLAVLWPVAWEIHPSEGTARFLDIPGCVTTPSMLLNILRMAADEHWSTRGKAAANVLQRLGREEQQVVLGKGGASNLLVLLVDNALAAKSASEALITMCTLLAHLLHVCPGGTTQSELLVSLPSVDLVPVSEVNINLGDWQHVVQGCIITRGRWLQGSGGQKAVDLDHCVETVLSLALSCLDPMTGSSLDAATNALNLLLAHEGQEGLTELGTFAILSPDDRHALANIIAKSAKAELINLRPVALQLHPHDDIAKHLLSEFASSPSSVLLLSIMGVAVARNRPWSGAGKEALSALQLMPLEAQERVLKDEKQEDGKMKKKKIKDGGLSHLVLLLLADTATVDDAKAALSRVSLVLSYLMLAHTAGTTKHELPAVLPPAYVGLAGSLSVSQNTWRLVVPKLLYVCEQWMKGADVETASQMEQCIGQMLMMAMRPAGPGDNMSMGSKVWILQEILPSAKAHRSPVALHHARKMLEALCDQVAVKKHGAEGRALAEACWKLIGWVSKRRILISLTLSPPWLLPLLGTMCHSLAVSHGGRSWTKDIPPELEGQGLLFAATTCNLQGHHKEVLQLMKQYLSKNKKVPNTMVDVVLQACAHQQKWDTVGWPLLEALNLGLHVWSSDDGMKKGMECLKQLPVEQASNVMTLMEACMYDEQVSPEARTRMSLAAAELVLTFQPVNESSLSKILDAYAVCAESALDHCSTASDHPSEVILDPRFHCRKAEELVRRFCSETPATEEEEDSAVVTPSALIYTALISVYAAAQQPTEAVQVAVNLSMASDALRHPCPKTLPALTAKPGQRALPAADACWWARSHLPLAEWLEVVHCSMQVAASQGCYRGVSYLFQEALLQAGAVQHEGIIQEVLGCLPDDQATTRPDQKQLLFDVIEAVGEEGYYHMEDWEGGMLKADASWLARLRVDNTSSRKYVQDRTEELAQAWVAPSIDNAENDQLDNEGVQWTPYNDDSEDIKDEGVEDSAAESQPVDGAEIVAYFGGMAFKKSDEEWVARLYPGMKLRWYGSGADAGRQGLKTLIQSVKAGRVYHVFIQTNWNGHCGTAFLARACRQYKVSFLYLGADVKSRLKGISKDAA